MLEKFLTIKIRIVGIFFLLGVCQVVATSYEGMNLKEMLDRAEIAFHGVVINVVVEEQADEPWTIVTFEVKQALLGNLEEETNLAFYGGVLNDKVLNVNGMPSFTQGDEVIILAYNNNYYSPIVGFSQGLWRFGSTGFANSKGKLLGLKEGKLTLGDEAAGTEEILEAFTKALNGDSQ